MTKTDYLRLLQRPDYHEISGNKLTSYCSGLGGGSINYWDGKVASCDFVSPTTDPTAFVQILDPRHRINLVQEVCHYWQPDRVVSKYLTHNRAYVEECKTIHDDTFVSIIDMHNHELATDLIVRIDGAVNGESLVRSFDSMLVIEEAKRANSDDYYAAPSRIYKVLGFSVPTIREIGDSAYGVEFPISLRPSADYCHAQRERVVLVVAGGDTEEEAVGRFRRAMNDPHKLFEDRRREWEDYFRENVPELLSDNAAVRKMYYFINYALKANLYSFGEGFFKHDFVSTSKFRFPASWFWDHAFSAINEKWLNRMPIPVGSMLNVLEAQREDGLLPFSLCLDRFTYGDWDITQGFILPMAVWDYYLKSNDKEFIAKALPTIIRFDEWIAANRDPNGVHLVSVQVPGEGWDNSKRYIQSEQLIQSESPMIKEKRYIQSADFNTYFLIGRRLIAKMAAVLGDEGAASRFRAEAEKTASGILELWDEDAGQFLDRFEDNHERIPIKTPGGLIPMLAGIANEAQLERLVANLVDPEQFWTKFPIPTLDQRDPHYNTNDEYFSYWNGRVWPCVNWLILEALCVNGRYDTASELARLSIKMCTVTGEPECRENYNPHTGYPYLTDDTFNLSGFGGLFNDMLVRRVMGIQPNAPANEVYVNPLMNKDSDLLSISGVEIGSHTVDVSIERREGRVRLEFSHRGESAITLITSAGRVSVHNNTVVQSVTPFDAPHWLDL